MSFVANTHELLMLETLTSVERTKQSCSKDERLKSLRKVLSMPPIVGNFENNHLKTDDYSSSSSSSSSSTMITTSDDIGSDSPPKPSPSRVVLSLSCDC